MFQTLHLMFEAQYTELALAVDLIAERIRALGFPAPGTYAEYAKLSSIEETAGVRVAFLNLVSPSVKDSLARRKAPFEVTDPVPAVRELIRDLRGGRKAEPETDVSLRPAGPRGPASRHAG